MARLYLLILRNFFQRQQIVLLPGYGLTETSPVISISTLNANRPGTVGRPLRDIEIRISDEGEILTRGPHVMKGYYKNRVATDEIIREGWLHTGDLGTLSDDGYLTITGRKKEIIVLSTGKNVSPANLELKMMTAPLILRGFVLGDDQSFLAALIVPDPEVLRGEIFRRGISVSFPPGGTLASRGAGNVSKNISSVPSGTRTLRTNSQIPTPRS